MSAYRCGRFDRHAAEQVLNGDPGTGDHALNDLLAAAAAPAREGELGGENAAVTAFRAARLDPVPQVRRRSMIKVMVAKLLTAKLAAVVAAAAAAGGIATAAVTGYLPTSIGRDSTVAPATSAAPSTPVSASSDNHPTVTGHRDDHGAPPSPSPLSASPSLLGLCRAYTAGAGSERGKALESPPFAALITAAGGKDKVAPYCANLLAAQHQEPNSTLTTASPNDEAAEHSTEAHRPDKPSPSHPTGPPTTHPGH